MLKICNFFFTQKSYILASLIKSAPNFFLAAQLAVAPCDKAVVLVTALCLSQDHWTWFPGVLAEPFLSMGTARRAA